MNRSGPWRPGEVAYIRLDTEKTTECYEGMVIEYNPEEKTYTLVVRPTAEYLENLEEQPATASITFKAKTFLLMGVTGTAEQLIVKPPSAAVAVKLAVPMQDVMRVFYTQLASAEAMAHASDLEGAISDAKDEEISRLKEQLALAKR